MQEGTVRQSSSWHSQGEGRVRGEADEDGASWRGMTSNRSEDPLTAIDATHVVPYRHSRSDR